jgi:hypothetical protein
MLAVTVILVLQALGLGIALSKHGQTGPKHNVCVSMISVTAFWTCVWWLDCPIFN